MRELLFRITKKALRNGNVFNRIVEFNKINYQFDLWEGNTYKIISIDQYTGLMDKNKTKIFQGDILEIESGKPMVVSWSRKFASFCLNRDDWMFSHWFGESCNPEDCKIIGNIHQNKYLLS